MRGGDHSGSGHNTAGQVRRTLLRFLHNAHELIHFYVDLFHKFFDLLQSFIQRQLGLPSQAGARDWIERHRRLRRIGMIKRLANGNQRPVDTGVDPDACTLRREDICAGPRAAPPPILYRHVWGQMRRVTQ